MGMKLNWNSKLSSCLTAHLDAMLRSEQTASDMERIVARKSICLRHRNRSQDICITCLLRSWRYPVISPDGVVLSCDSNSEQVTPETDEKWRVIAAVSAVQKYPDLREMLPDKPPTAKSCSMCSGAGKVRLVKEYYAICGNCSGLGWTG